MNPVIQDSFKSLPSAPEVNDLGVQVFSLKRQILNSINASQVGDGWMFLLIIEGGCVFHLLTDRPEYDRGLVVIPPDSPDRTVILKDNFKGYLVTMPSSIISDKWPSKQYASLSEKEVVILKSYCVLMRDVLVSPGAAHSSKEMLCLSRAFVASCRQHFDVEIYANSYSRRAEIASGFLKMVEKYGHRERDLSFYSKRLSITQKYLSAVIVSATGKKASNIINERTIEYAKDLLMNTRMSVTDVSKEMDFKNPSDFCRYFKNSTGVSPNTFRDNGYRTHYHDGPHRIAYKRTCRS